MKLKEKAGYKSRVSPLEDEKLFLRKKFYQKMCHEWHGKINNEAEGLTKNQLVKDSLIVLAAESRIRGALGKY